MIEVHVLRSADWGVAKIKNNKLTIMFTVSVRTGMRCEAYSSLPNMEPCREEESIRGKGVISIGYVI